MFGEVTEERLESAALAMSYHLTPWDQPAFPGNSATISSIAVGDGQQAAEAFNVFRAWCASNQVKLVSCRLEQDRLTECAFLEANGFRFIELNFCSVINHLGRFTDDPDISVQPALPSDATEISQIAARIFRVGRFIIDPWLDPKIGHQRYRDWVLNAFQHPRQRVFKCVMAEQIVAFFIIETHRTNIKTEIWSLFGLSPAFTGQGMGRRTTRAMLAFERGEGVETVEGSPISSSNIAMLGLMSSLGAFFPAPTITLHWCPLGPVGLPSLGES